MKVAGQPLDLVHTPVSMSMTADPFTLPPTPTSRSLSKIVLEGFHHIPLVDDVGRRTAVVEIAHGIEYLGESC